MYQTKNIFQKIHIRGVFDKYPEKSYNIVSHEGILMKLGKMVDTSMLYVMYYCSCRILNITRNIVSIVTLPSLNRPKVSFFVDAKS